MKMMFIYLVLVAGTISTAVFASDELSQNEIRQLVKAGEILPLDTILSQYPETEYGKLLDLEVEREGNRIEYELEFLRSDGHVIEIKIDAKNGQLIEQEIE
jgi:uncharacterized membrane protein YkoI